METIGDQVKDLLISAGGGSPQTRESSSVQWASDDRIGRIVLLEESKSRVAARKMTFLMAALLLLVCAVGVTFGIVGIILAQSMQP